MTYKKLYHEEPPCAECLPELQNENVLPYEVYWRMFGPIESLDTFKIMRLVGIGKKDFLYCLDLVTAARNEVMRLKFLKETKK